MKFGTNEILEPCERKPEFFAHMTIQLGELIEGGFVDLNDRSWRWDYYNDAQGIRVNQKIIDRYYYREIGILPPGKWKREFIRVINEIMPKLKPLYKAIDDGFSLLDTSDEYIKSREVYSDFPATQINPANQDYAANAIDRQIENVKRDNVIDAFDKIAKDYRDIDVIILDELEKVFSCILTPTLNGF